MVILCTGLLGQCVQFNLQGEGESSIQWEEIIPAKNSDSKDGMHHQMFILNDLEKNSTYHVQMVAHNQVGSGEWADTFTFTTPAGKRQGAKAS